VKPETVASLQKAAKARMVISTSWGKLKRRYRDLPGDTMIYGPGIGLAEDDPGYDADTWPNKKSGSAVASKPMPAWLSKLHGKYGGK
jgi:hypothetical protein